MDNPTVADLLPEHAKRIAAYYRTLIAEGAPVDLAEHLTEMMHEHMLKHDLYRPPHTVLNVAYGVDGTPVTAGTDWQLAMKMIRRC